MAGWSRRPWAAWVLGVGGCRSVRGERHGLHRGSAGAGRGSRSRCRGGPTRGCEARSRNDGARDQSTHPAAAYSTSWTVRWGPSWETVVADALGLEQADHALHQGVGIADRPDRGADALEVEVLGEPNRGVFTHDATVATVTCPVE